MTDVWLQLLGWGAFIAGIFVEGAVLGWVLCKDYHGLHQLHQERGGVAPRGGTVDGGAEGSAVVAQ